MANPAFIEGVLGYALNLVAIQIVSRGIPVSLGSVASPESYVGSFSFMFATCYALAFLLVGLRGMVHLRLGRGFAFWIAACLLGGCLLTILATQMSVAEQYLVFCTAVLFGFGLAGSFAFWQQHLYGLGEEDCARCIVIGTMVTSVILAPIFWIQSGFLLIILIPCMLIDIALITKCCRFVPHSSFANDTVIQVTGWLGPIRLLKSIWRHVLCLGIIGLTCRLSRAFIVDADAISLTNILYSVGMILSATLFYSVWKRDRLLSSFRSMYGLFMIITAALFMMFPLFGSSYHIAVATITYLAFSWASLHMVLTSIEVAHGWGVSPTMSFGLLAGLFYLITDSGPILLQISQQVAALHSLPQAIVAAALVIYLIPLGLMLLKTSRDPIRDDIDITADSNESEQQAFEWKRAEKIDYIPDCCAELKHRYRLTTRQAEILELIVRGRDLVRIADALCLSHNTVRSHCRNLYLKMGVHSKQEIISIVDEMCHALQIENPEKTGSKGDFPTAR